MEINKNSWHYKTYAWSYEWDFGEAPKEINLCAYVRRLMFGVPVNGLFFGIIFLIVGLVAIAATVLMFPFGYYLRHPLINYGNPHVGSYNGLRIGKFNLLPWHVIVPALIVLLAWGNYHMFHLYGAFNKLTIIEAFCSIPLLILGVIFFCFNTDIGGLVKGYVDAKTKGICPLITFRDDQ